MSTAFISELFTSGLVSDSSFTVSLNSAPDWFLCRFPSISLCDPSSGGVPRASGESGLHFLHWSVCPWTFPPAGRPHPDRHPGREAVPYSLQSAEALRSWSRSGARSCGPGPRAHESGPLPGSATPDPATLPAGLAAVGPAAGAGDEPAATAAVSHQTSPAGRDGEESTSPPGAAAGQ